MHFRAALYAAVSSSALVLCAPQAFAQDAAGGVDDEGQLASTSEYGSAILVQARRREESIIQVPASVVRLDSEVLLRQGVQDFEDLAFAVPNVLITQNGDLAARSGVSIRGIPGRAGIYVDDVFVGDAAGVSTLLVDIDSVQVLRGPQGTLFGRNAMSGAINTITRKPSDDFSASVDLQYGEYDLVVVRGAINGPITDGVSAKVSGGYRSRDTYEKSAGVGRLNAEDGYIVQGQIKFEPTDTVTILLNADYLDETVETAGGEVTRDFGFFGGIYGVAAIDGDPDDRTVPGRNVTPTADREQLNLWGRADIDLGFAKLTSITNHREIDFLYTRDGDGSAYDYLRGQQPVDFEQFSQEVRLTSESGGMLDWMLGAYYFESDRSSTDANTVGLDAFVAYDPNLAGLIPAFYPGGTAGVITGTTLLANPIIGNFDPTLGFVLSQLQASQATDFGTTTTSDFSSVESTAFWGSLTVRPTDAWELTGGVRYTDETLGGSYDQTVSGLLPLFGVPSVLETVLPDRSDDNVSFNASLSYFPAEDMTLYASFAQGFRSGGYNLAPGAATAEERAFDSEKVGSFELGFKTALFDKRAIFNLAAFYSEYTDFQRAFLRATPTGFVNETLNTDATIKGIEADFFAQLTDRLFVSAAYGFQDSSYDDYPDAPINTTAGLQVVDLTGERLPFVSMHSFTTGFQYEHPLSESWNLMLTTDVQYRSNYTVTDSDGSEPETTVGGTVLVNPSIGIHNEDAGLRIVLRAFNLFDEVFTTGVDFNTFTGVVGRNLSAPRTVSLQIRKDF